MPRQRKTDKHLPPCVHFKRGQHYLVGSSVSPDGKQVRKWIPLGASYGDAMRKWSELTTPAGPIVSMADLFDAYFREVCPTKSPTTQRHELECARWLRPYFDPSDPRYLEPVHIYQFKDGRRESPVAFNRERSLLMSVFNLAIEKGIRSTNPVREVKRFPEKSRDRLPSHAELKSFISHDDTPPEIRAYVPFKILTGLGQGEILTLKKSALQKDGIHTARRKGGRPRIITWTKALRAAKNAIGKLRRPATSIYLFTKRNGQPYTSTGFQSIWQKHMRRCLTDPKNALTERFTEHDLRARAATDANERGKSAMNLLGHQDKKTTDVYLGNDALDE